MTDREKFAVLRGGTRVWAVAAIHGEAGRLSGVHDRIAERLVEGDRLVYLGNLIGHGQRVAETMDELLRFRIAFLARPRAFACDVAYLRGNQEEMWDKLLQLQFAPSPPEVLGWMLHQGLAGTLAAYGSSAEEALGISRQGAVAISRWTGQLRARMQARGGHGKLLNSLKRAAYSDDGGLLFVNAGIDPSRPLTAQSDSFWWGGGRFGSITSSYAGFARVVRGFDPSHGGQAEGEFTATIDAGCGFGGPLAAACFDSSGAILDWVEG
ncbi:MAG: hypothetical protein KJ904_17370 [Alphaproteobacteria bacterium]|nr:hypothetical protein [Alphaproteobacteria bacterium]MBU0797284.1 hypothetical protein [Alphaproteobacteria bacterium]MBU0888928.1 hypothetical protein [Alphaproteobacteria bacterium]MBU1813948.1 hypothetical protein [Alphaproteobacteria bacterium]MBU2089239.1 hypothetical protein [Alphaproteobacteria bacterium]